MTSHPSFADENDLIEAAQQGKLEAFTVLYERYLPAVFNRVRYLVPEEDVEDVTQDVFIAALRSLRGFRGTAQFSTWLRTITNRQIADYYRRRHLPESALDERLRAPHDPVAADEVFIIRQAFRRLPQKYQEILLLRFAEGLHFDEIARLQGRTLEATKSFFRRAVAALHKQVTGNE
ncbi:MAG TPA: sigma-70 family RNA polymerase sigma factor [Anaerolineales bacterium]|nr:sigma-70 family RNA polymerase sigma factor [Anaerolineales bacterium]